VLGLINCCDAYVSLHRSEGFGRTVAEAILLNKPTLATGYSGNLDLAFSPFYRNAAFNLIDVEDYHWVTSEDSAKWADVQVSDAAEKLLQIKADKRTKQILQNERLSVKYVSSIMVKQIAAGIN
jgi:glycosyltransferase involved in cell wall biosynthesis